VSVHSFNLYDIYNRNALIFSHRRAIVFEKMVDTFQSLLSKVNCLAGGLRSMNVRKGDRVAILARNRPEIFTILGAAARLGLIVVPINWRLSTEEIQYIIDDTTPRMLFSSHEFKDTVISVMKHCKCLKQVVGLGIGGDEGLISFDDLIIDVPFEEEPEVSDNDPFLIIHTAAVKGRSLGAVLSHSNIISSDIQYMYLMGLNEEDVYLNVLPLFHVAGLTLALAVLHAGGTNVIVPGFDPVSVLQTIENERVTIMGNFPPMLTKLREAILGTQYDISSLRHVRGMDTLDNIEWFEKRTNAKFWAAYGQTETSGAVSISLYSERPGSAGKTSPLCAIEIVDDCSMPLGPGETGEIAVRGPLIFQGYWNNVEATKQTFRRGWHHTGDLGHFDEDGFLWYAGRKAEKELIKPGGENVYPAEVEKVILQHPAVEKTVVFGVPDPKWKEGIKAVCQLKKGMSLEAQELIDFVGERIARYKKPQYVEFVDEIPLQEDGTPDRAKVKELYGGEQL